MGEQRTPATKSRRLIASRMSWSQFITASNSNVHQDMVESAKARICLGRVDAVSLHVDGKLPTTRDACTKPSDQMLCSFLACGAIICQAANEACTSASLPPIQDGINTIHPPQSAIVSLLNSSVTGMFTILHPALQGHTGQLPHENEGMILGTRRHLIC